MKIGTCSAQWKWEVEQQPLPQIGFKTAVLNGNGQPICIIETTEMTVCAFNEVDAEVADDEREGALYSSRPFIHLDPLFISALYSSRINAADRFR
ncbi:MAG: ASCH domain-containing protein [Cyanobacteria bacterium P01_E01_bin.6]